jgi:hypothetical protein
MNIKNYSKAKYISYASVLVAIIAVVLSTQVGTSGGEIRHTEIRDDSVNTRVHPEGSISKEQATEDDEK